MTSLGIPWIFYRGGSPVGQCPLSMYTVHVLDFNMKVCLTSVFLVCKTARDCNRKCMLKMVLKEGNFQKKILAMGESGGEGGNGVLFGKSPLLFELDQEEQEVVQHFTSEVNTKFD